MANIIQSSISKIQNFAKKFTDDKGFYQRGQFTPVKGIAEYTKPYVNPNWKQDLKSTWSNPNKAIGSAIESATTFNDLKSFSPSFREKANFFGSGARGAYTGTVKGLTLGLVKPKIQDTSGLYRPAESLSQAITSTIPLSKAGSAASKAIGRPMTATALQGKALKTALSPTFIGAQTAFGGGLSAGAKMLENMASGNPLSQGVLESMGQGALESLYRAPSMGAVIGLTGPAIEFAGKYIQGMKAFNRLSPTLKAQVLDRVVGSTLNVVEGIGLDRSLGMETDAISLGTDALTGALMGTGAVKGLNDPLRKAIKENVDLIVKGMKSEDGFIAGRGIENDLPNSKRYLPEEGVFEFSVTKDGKTIKSYTYDSPAMAKAQIDKVKGTLKEGEMITPVRDITPEGWKPKRRLQEASMGAIAGMEPEYDEDGNFIGFKYNPVKGLLGVGIMGGTRAIKDQKIDFNNKPKVTLDKKGQIKVEQPKVKIPKPDMSLREDVQRIVDQGSVSRTGIKEKVQDSLIRIKRLQSLKNVKVDEKSDIYVAEELMHGRVGARLENSYETIRDIDTRISDFEKIDKNIYKKVQDYLIAQHAPERNKALGDGAAGIKTKEARKVLNDIESDPNSQAIKAFAQEFENLNKQVLDILLEGQVITKDLYETLRTKYKHHIPLNRIMDDADDAAQILTGSARDVRGTGIKAAKGSDKPIADIVGNIVTNLQQAVIRAEKNKVNLAILEFARKNPELGLFDIRKPKAIGKTFDGKPIMAKTNDPQVLVLRENGKEVHLFINNPKIATTLRGINIEKVPPLIRTVGAFTRLYSQLHTRFNPEFALPNIVRDSQEMATYLTSQKDVGVSGAAKTLGKQPQSVKTVFDSIRGVDNADTRLYKQMQLDGGTTGGMALSTKQDIDLQIEKIRKLNRSNPRKAANMIVSSFDNWNKVFEDATRFSVYKQAIENGASRQRAASLAKNASLNFNRKGTATPLINALWMFSNASIQGTTKMLTALKNPKTLGIVTTAVGSAVYAANEWNENIDPEWREKVSKWDQQSNLVVMLPSKDGVKYITIPVSWGLKPIKTTLDAAYRAYKGELQDVNNVASDISQAFIDGYNPVGGTDLYSMAMPTIGDIPLEILRNKSWSGGMVRPTYLEGEPKHKQMFKNTGKTISGRVGIYIANKLAELTEGRVDVSPNDLLYAYNQYIGGVGRFATKSGDTISQLIEGKAPDLDTIPFGSRFASSRSGEEIKKTKVRNELDEIRNKYNAQWDTKLENAYDYLKSPKTLDENGLQARNRNESMAFAQIRLANPQIVARESEEARARSKIEGTPYNPLYDLPYDKQRTVLTLATLPPGPEKSALQKENIEWLKPYWNEVADYSSEMKRLGIFKDNPNFEAPPRASARAQAQMDAGNWRDPEVQAYLQANNEYKNRVRAELGLSPLESFASKFGGYTRKPQKAKFNMGKVKKARVKKSSGAFKTRKIKTPKLKAISAPRIRPVAKITAPKIRSKFRT